MQYVGIRGSAEKEALLAGAPDATGEAVAGDLAYDCVRHLDFLRLVAEGGEDAFPATLYWKYQLAAGRSGEAALERCRRFAALYETVRSNGFDPATAEPIAVTDDGIRLNGSHRAAIAVFLGLERLPVEVHHSATRLPARRLRVIRAEAATKREAQERYLGRTARDRAEGRPLGRVAFVDARPATRLRRLLGPPMEPVLALETPGGELVFLPAREVRVE